MFNKHFARSKNLIVKRTMFPHRKGVGRVVRTEEMRNSNKV